MKKFRHFDALAIKQDIESSGISFFRGVHKNQPLEVNTDGLSARFLRFSLQTVTSFHLDEIEVLGEGSNNIALNKLVISSSAFNDESKYKGASVVNGKKTGGCGFHSKLENSPWIVIDLGALSKVELIRIYNRDDEFFSRALSLKVESSPDLKAWNLVYDNWSGLKRFLAESICETQNAIAYAAALEHGKPIALYNRLIAAGDKFGADSLKSSVNKVIESHGLAMGPHGFLRTFSFFSLREKEFVCSELGLILHWINVELGVPAFITSGTLLGYVRENDFISHDDDLDICYIGSARNPEGIVEERRKISAFLASKGCGVQQSSVAHLWCTTPGGVKLDIFTGFVEEGDCCSINPLPRRSLSKSSILPLKLNKFFGSDIYIPSAPSDLLSVNYGDDWRQPDPSWRFDWSRAKQEYHFLYFGE